MAFVSCFKCSEGGFPPDSFETDGSEVYVDSDSGCREPQYITVHDVPAFVACQREKGEFRAPSAPSKIGMRLQGSLPPRLRRAENPWVNISGKKCHFLRSRRNRFHLPELKQPLEGQRGHRFPPVPWGWCSSRLSSKAKSRSQYVHVRLFETRKDCWCEAHVVRLGTVCEASVNHTRWPVDGMAKPAP